MSEPSLPFVDEHRTLVAAPADVVWRALAVQVPRFAAAENFARLVGAVPSRAAGDVLTEGATLPGFAVAEADPGRRLRLAGRHRFSRYALTLSLTPAAGGTTLSARTDAAFPGPLGAAYRLMVIGSGAHAVLVRRLLRDVRRRAERRA
ncbi:SRPBCC family protein [Micromonospora sp. NPDC000089]|uniref:SRPBCC family protein n=1 Tax=unclassified Micromonospora TaxID=2617518 RepID=UPI00368EEF01